MGLFEEIDKMGDDIYSAAVAEFGSNHQQMAQHQRQEQRAREAQSKGPGLARTMASGFGSGVQYAGGAYRMQMSGRRMGMPGPTSMQDGRDDGFSMEYGG